MTQGLENLTSEVGLKELGFLNLEKTKGKSNHSFPITKKIATDEVEDLSLQGCIVAEEEAMGIVASGEILSLV